MQEKWRNGPRVIIYFWGIHSTQSSHHLLLSYSRSRATGNFIFFSFLVKSHILTPYWFFYWIWTYPPNFELSLSLSQNTMSTFNLPQSKIQSWVLVIVMLTSDTLLFLSVASGHENMESWRWLFAGVGPNVFCFFFFLVEIKWPCLVKEWYKNSRDQMARSSYMKPPLNFNHSLEIKSNVFITWLSPCRDI